MAAYEDALRLWVLVHDPANAGEHRSDGRIRKLVHDAVGVVEEDYEDPNDGDITNRAFGV